MVVIHIVSPLVHLRLLDTISLYQYYELLIIPTMNSVPVIDAFHKTILYEEASNKVYLINFSIIDQLPKKISY